MGKKSVAKKAEALGFEYFVVKSVDDVVDLLKNYKNF